MIEYIILFYLACLFITAFGSTIYHRSQRNFTERVGKEIDQQTAARMIAKINSYHREVLTLSVIPIVNTITAIVMLLGAIRELLNGIDELIIQVVDLWRKVKAWTKR